MKTQWLPAAGLLLLSLLFTACGSTGNMAADTTRDNQVNVGYGTADKDVPIKYSEKVVDLFNKCRL